MKAKVSTVGSCIEVELLSENSDECKTLAKIFDSLGKVGNRISSVSCHSTTMVESKSVKINIKK